MSSGFNNHLDNPKEPEVLSARRTNAADNNASDLGKMLLLDFAKEIKEKVIINASSTSSPIDLRLESTRSEIFRVHPTFGLCNASSVYQKMIISIYPTLGEDLDHHLYVGDEGATASREAPIFDSYSDLC